MKLLKKIISFCFLTILFCWTVAWGQCPEGNVIIETQTQVDSFPILYPNCTELENLVIGGVWPVDSDITDLSPLSQITLIRGNLKIEENDELITLSGLDNLTSVEGDLNIRYNSYLISLSNLENVTSIGGDLIISTNNNLTKLSGLDNVTSIGGDLIIQLMKVWLICLT